MPRKYFDADGLKLLSETYQAAMAELGQYQAITDEIADVVAGRLFSAAAKGNRDPADLHRLAVEGYLPKGASRR